MTEFQKVTCACETYIPANSLHEALLLWTKNDEYIQNDNGNVFRLMFS